VPCGPTPVGGQPDRAGTPVAVRALGEQPYTSGGVRALLLQNGHATDAACVGSRRSPGLLAARACHVVRCGRPETSRAVAPTTVACRRVVAPMRSAGATTNSVNRMCRAREPTKCATASRVRTHPTTARPTLLSPVRDAALAGVGRAEAAGAFRGSRGLRHCRQSGFLSAGVATVGGHEEGVRRRLRDGWFHRRWRVLTRLVAVLIVPLSCRGTGTRCRRLADGLAARRASRGGSIPESASSDGQIGMVLPRWGGEPC